MGLGQLQYIRIRKHYIQIPYLVLGVIEFGLLMSAVYLAGAFMSRSVSLSQELIELLWPPAMAFAVIMSCCTLSMGSYVSLVREGYSSMVLRTLVSFCLLGSVAVFIIGIFFPQLFVSQTLLFWAIIAGLALVFAARWVFVGAVDAAKMKRRVLIYGAGLQAKALLDSYHSESNALGVEIFGCVLGKNETIAVNPDLVKTEPSDWGWFIKDNDISEVVIAPDERRSSMGGSFPVEELLDCKLSGVRITDVLGFYEREMNKIELSQLHPGWMLFSDGFRYSKVRDFIKRVFDLSISLLLLVILWPFMLLTAALVFLESGRPMLYRQMRVGLHGKEFPIYKFRSMRQDAEKGGKAVWATQNDSRVTKVGAFIRNTRLDELPQLYNVIMGHMSFIGPRPERPEFVSELTHKIPYYQIRHRVKPGLMGWAQLKYPYGASVEDAENKLRYDLYYTKNHSFLMDVLILIQTVEVVLLGKGVH